MDSPTEITANQEDRSKHGDMAVEKTGIYQNDVVVLLFVCFCFSSWFDFRTQILH